VQDVLKERSKTTTKNVSYI